MFVQPLMMVVAAAVGLSISAQVECRRREKEGKKVVGRCSSREL